MGFADWGSEVSTGIVESGAELSAAGGRAPKVPQTRRGAVGGAVTVVSRTQPLREAAAFSSWENLEPAGSPGHGEASASGGSQVPPATGLGCLLTWLGFGSLNSQRRGPDTGWPQRGGLAGWGRGRPSTDVK